MWFWVFFRKRYLRFSGELANSWYLPDPHISRSCDRNQASGNGWKTYFHENIFSYGITNYDNWMLSKWFWINVSELGELISTEKIVDSEMDKFKVNMVQILLQTTDFPVLLCSLWTCRKISTGAISIIFDFLKRSRSESFISEV